MENKVSGWLPFIIFGALLSALWFGLKQNPHAVNSPLIGKPVPAFQLSLVNNKNKVVNQSIFKGYISLLNVFASWCPSCHKEHSFLMRLKKNKKVRIVGVDYKDVRAKAKQWLYDQGSPYKIVLFDRKGHFGIDLGVYGVPETFLVDQKGIIQYKYTGILTDSVWKNQFQPRIKKLEHA